MKNFKLVLVLMFTIALINIACSKDESEQTISAAQKNLQTSWKKDKVERRSSDGTWQDITRICNRDDVEEYKSDNNWTLYPGTNLCNAEAVTLGRWSLRANDTKIIYSYNGISGEYESSIEKITEISLILTQNVGDVSNTQMRFTYSKLN